METLFSISCGLRFVEYVLEDITSKKSTYKVDELTNYIIACEKGLSDYREIAEKDLINYDNSLVDLNDFPKEKIKANILEVCDTLEKKYIVKLKKELKKRVKK